MGDPDELLEVLFRAMERHVYERCVECQARKEAGRLSGCGRYQRMWVRYTRITHGTLEANLRSRIYARR